MIISNICTVGDLFSAPSKIASILANILFFIFQNFYNIFLKYL